MRSHVVALSLVAFAAPAFAQTPPPPVVPGTVTAEAAEVVRVKPDQAKVYVTAASRNADPATASDEAGELAKKFADLVTRLKVKGLKAVADPVKVAKLVDERSMVLRGGGIGGVAAPPADTQASQQLVITITDPDPKALADAVDKVQREAIKEGLTGAAPDGMLSTRYTSDMVKVAYLKQDGIDDLLAAALGKATKKATARAEAIAGGLGMKLGAVVSADELPAGGDPTSALVTTSALSRGSTAVSPSAELVEGELVRTVRVRVVYAVK
jgi:uncharacterized protein YggE